MKFTRRQAVTGAALVGAMLSPMAAQAQCVGNLSQPTPASRWGFTNALLSTRNTATICGGSGGSAAKAWVTILGGSAKYGAELWYLGTPPLAAGNIPPLTADPVTGELIEPTHKLGQLLFNAAATDPDGDGGSDWFDAPGLDPVALNPSLGPLTVGSTLAFGLKVYYKHYTGVIKSYWVYSHYAGAGTNVGNAGLGNLFVFGPSSTVYQDGARTAPVPNTPPGGTYVPGETGHMVLGFEDKPESSPADVLPTEFFADGLGDRDFNDMVFALSYDVAPEPASLALMASGLIGLGGLTAIRRRRNG